MVAPMQEPSNFGLTVEIDRLHDRPESILCWVFVYFFRLILQKTQNNKHGIHQWS
jgi:hypothetical protein